MKDFKAKPIANLDWPSKDEQTITSLTQKRFNNQNQFYNTVKQAANHPDSFVRHASLESLKKFLEEKKQSALRMNFDLSERERSVLRHVLSKVRSAPSINGRITPYPNSPIEEQFEFLRWAADTKQAKLRPQIEANLKAGPANFRLFRAYLACLDELDSRANPDRFNEKFALPLLEKAGTSDTLRGHVLRYFPDNHKAINSKKLIAWMGSKNKSLRLEAIWKTRSHLDEASNAALRKLALDEKEPLELRLAATAVFGTSESPDSGTLLEIAKSNHPALRDEALRSLVGAHFEADGEQQLVKLNTPASKRAIGKPFINNPPEPTDSAAWLKRLDALKGKPDAAAGERIFFNRKVATCSNCHQVNERGTRVGPDLTHIGRGLSRERLLESILQPNKEVSPYLRTWVITMKNGKVHSGIAMRRGGNSEVYLGIDGKEIRLSKQQIKSKIEGSHSLMPPGLAHTLALEELRDLLAFLKTPR